MNKFESVNKKAIAGLLRLFIQSLDCVKANKACSVL